MPLLLTTPYDPGAADPSGSYPRGKILGFSIDTEKSTIHFDLEYGDVNGDVWERGGAAPRKQYVVADADYDAMVVGETTAGEGHVIYAGAKRVLYQWLIDNGHEAGTVE